MNTSAKIAILILVLLTLGGLGFFIYYEVSLNTSVTTAATTAVTTATATTAAPTTNSA
jgi:hypothetical protein